MSTISTPSAQGKHNLLIARQQADLSEQTCRAIKSALDDRNVAKALHIINQHLAAAEQRAKILSKLEEEYDAQNCADPFDGRDYNDQGGRR